MRPVVVTSLGLILALPGVAGAQPASQGPGASAVSGPAQGLGPGGTRESGASAQARGSLLAPEVAPTAGLGAFPPPGQKPPRPEKAIGPDLASYIFAPIGGIVGPITEGLHAFDAAIAPINEALQPLTGPYGADLVVGPDGAPLPSEASAAVAAPGVADPPQQPVRGPRK